MKFNLFAQKSETAKYSTSIRLPDIMSNFIELIFLGGQNIQQLQNIIYNKHNYATGFAELNAYLGTQTTRDRHQTDRKAEKQTDKHAGVCIELLNIHSMPAVFL